MPNRRWSPNRLRSRRRIACVSFQCSPKSFWPGTRPSVKTKPIKGAEKSDNTVALSGTERRAVCHQRGRHLSESQESDRAADGDRNDAVGGEYQLSGVFALFERYRRTSLRILYSDRGRSRSCHRFGDSGGAVP